MTTKNPKNSYDKDSGHVDIEELIAMSGPRPLLPHEAEELLPGSSIDKAEEHSPRCEICFGPMPCGDHANVETLATITSLDINPTLVLANAHDAGLEQVVIMGVTKDGKEFFASSCADAAEGMYYAQRAIYNLHKVVDGEFENEHTGPGQPAA